MRTVIIGIAALATGAAVVRLGPGLAQRGMAKCHQMMADMQHGAQQGCACHEEPLKATTV